MPVFGAIEDAARGARRGHRGRARRVGSRRCRPPPTPATDVGYFGARRLLPAAGVPFPAASSAAPRPTRSRGRWRDRRTVRAQGAAPAAQVRRGRRRRRAARCRRAGRRRTRTMHARLGAPSYSVEAMADLSDGVELIVGVNADRPLRTRSRWWDSAACTPRSSGTWRSRWRPYRLTCAADLLRALRAAALLAGVRGAGPPSTSRRRPRRSRAHHARSPRPTPRSPRSRSTRCWSRRTGALALDARAILA